MNGVSKVQDCRARRQGDALPLRSEEVDLFGVEGFLEFLHQIDSTLVALLQRGAYLLQPLLYGVVLYLLLRVRLFVQKMSRHALFSYGVHAVRTDLHLYPASYGRHHCRLQALVTVVLRMGDPISETLGIGRELASD